MSLDRISMLLKELGKLVGLPDLCFDEQGYCCLGFDDAIRVHMRYNENADELVLYSDLASYEADAPGNAALFESLLAANLFWQGTSGGTLSVDREARRIYLMHYASVEGMDFQRFQAVLESFVNRSEFWLGELGGDRNKDMPKNEDEVDSGQPHPSDLA